MARVVDRTIMMEILKTPLEGLALIKPAVFRDDRGYFLETYNERELSQVIAPDLEFVQDNESMSGLHVLRGLHYQDAPYAQGKLVRVVQGAVLDVAVDIRPNSPTYGKHITVRLDDQNKHMLWIPPGFAHGFLALADRTIFVYKCTAPYHKASERTIRWDDPDIGIDWGIQDPLVSDKDRAGAAFRSLTIRREDTAL